MTDLDDDADREALKSALADAFSWMRMANDVLLTCVVLIFADVALFYLGYPVGGALIALVILGCANAWVEAVDMVRVARERSASISKRIERRRDV